MPATRLSLPTQQNRFARDIAEANLSKFRSLEITDADKY